jgi:hypothetical protein
MAAEQQKVALGRTYDGVFDDVTKPNAPVEVTITRNATGHVLHVNVGGVCVFRMCRVQDMAVNLDRSIWKEVQRGG